MPKSPEKNALTETVSPSNADAVEAPAASQPVDEPRAPEQTPDPKPDEQAPDVKVVLSQDFKALVDSYTDPKNHSDDVYVSIAFLPEELAEADGRFKVPTTPTAVPADVADALTESPAVEVAE